MAEQAWALSETGITVYENGFEEYEAARRAGAAAPTELPDAARGAKADALSGSDKTAGLSREELKRLKREQAEQRNALYKQIKPLQNDYAKLEQRLEAALTEQGEVEATLADPAVYADGGRATELLRRFNELRDAGELLIEQMAELETRIAELEARRAAVAGGEA